MCSDKILLEKIKKLSSLIGNTPLYRFSYQGNNILAKLESFNLSRSAKDRSAFNMIYQAILAGEITSETTIIESSSGNFAISLAGICNFLGLKFISVTDPNINPVNADILRLICHKVIQVTERDHTGGFLLTRLQAVREYCETHPQIYWPDQYNNIHNPMAYYYMLGDELQPFMHEIDAAFVAVSTGGMLKGLSLKLKEENPNIKIYAVDVEGSLIFSNEPKLRKFSGIGSSIRPRHIEGSLEDEVVIVSEDSIVEGCHKLLSGFALFCGASSGAVFAAIDKVINTDNLMGKNILCILPDSGISYLTSIYKHSHPVLNDHS